MNDYLINLYKLYIYALQVREEYGSQYGHIDELIKMYEDKLEANGIKVRSRGKGEIK